MADSSRASSVPHIGDHFGSRTILEDLGSRDYLRFVRVQCDCGRIDEVPYTALHRRRIDRCMSCRRPPHLKHGYSNKTPEYTTWRSMRDRCANPSNRGYANYGGRGITICPEWDDFSVFLEDMGKRPSPKHSIERRDNSLGYSRDNCCWATQAEQNRNKRTNTRLEWNGRNQTIADWAREVGIKEQTLRGRVLLGWTAEKALTTPTLQRSQWSVKKRT